MQYSIMNLKEVMSHRDFRFDAEYYKPEFINFVSVQLDKYLIWQVTKMLKKGDSWQYGN
jgi:hypothetical protein